MNQILKNQIGEGWYNQLSSFIESKDFTDITNVILKKPFAPQMGDVFKSFEKCKWEDLRVVILGQDPYHTIITNKYNETLPQASGLCFGIPKETTYIPPSLKNIKKELENQYKEEIPYFDYTLESWAKQGVLLLNTALTVEYNKPGSHADIWNKFTKFVIQKINQNSPGTIWLLWGGHARGYKKYINNKTHHILESSHPSPLSANRGGWFGNNHFIQVDNIIEKQNGPFDRIEWYDDQTPF